MLRQTSFYATARGAPDATGAGRPFGPALGLELLFVQRVDARERAVRTQRFERIGQCLHHVRSVCGLQARKSGCSAAMKTSLTSATLGGLGDALSRIEARDPQIDVIGIVGGSRSRGGLSRSSRTNLRLVIAFSRRNSPFASRVTAPMR